MKQIYVSYIIVVTLILHVKIAVAKHDEGNEDPFHELSEEIANRETNVLTDDGLRKLYNMLGDRLPSIKECFNRTSKDSLPQNINDEEFFNISTTLIYSIINGKCADEGIGNLSSLRTGNVNLRSKEIFDNLQQKRDYHRDKDTELCFNAATLQRKSSNLKNLYARVILYIYEGRCLLPTSNYFENEYIEYLKKNETGIITKKAFENLLSSMKIGKVTSVSKDNDHSHDEHNSEDDAHEHHDDDNDTHKCYSSQELYDIYGAGENISVSLVIEMCPALVQQLVTGSCTATTRSIEEDVNNNNTSTYTKAMMYGYGTASVAIISLLALLGMVLFPVLETKSYHLTMQFFIGLGVSTMASDALLHIVPYVLEIHVHSDSSHEDSHDKNLEFVWKMSVVLGGIYIFFIFESCLKIWKRLRNNSSRTTQSDQVDQVTLSNSQSVTSFSAEATEDIEPNRKDEGAVLETAVSEEMLARDDIICYNLTTTCITVFVGDILHNFADGIAIGVSFSTSWTAGIGTSLAIICHELPHEFGDFAIYLKNGATKCQAIMLNFSAACCAFLGLYGGILLGSDESVRMWLMAVIAGMFLYISLVQVMREMVSDIFSQPILQFFLQNLGLVLGWVILLLIAIYEEDMENIIEG